MSASEWLARERFHSGQRISSCQRFQQNPPQRTNSINFAGLDQRPENSEAEEVLKSLKTHQLEKFQKVSPHSPPRDPFFCPEHLHSTHKAPLSVALSTTQQLSLACPIKIICTSLSQILLLSNSPHLTSPHLTSTIRRFDLI